MSLVKNMSGLKINRSTITVISKWAWWRLKATASRLFTQSFIQALIKENIKAPRHWPLRQEFTSDRWIPLAKMFPFDEFIMLCVIWRNELLQIRIRYKFAQRCSITYVLHMGKSMLLQGFIQPILDIPIWWSGRLGITDVLGNVLLEDWKTI